MTYYVPSFNFLHIVDLESPIRKSFVFDNQCPKEDTKLNIPLPDYNLLLILFNLPESMLWQFFFGWSTILPLVSVL